MALYLAIAADLYHHQSPGVVRGVVWGDKGLISSDGTPAIFAALAGEQLKLGLAAADKSGLFLDFC